MRDKSSITQPISTSEVKRKSKIDSVIVKYKEYLPNGEEIISKNSYKSWNEEGSYTIFYDSYSLDSAVFIIPTRFVLCIEILRDE